ncbi:hypothetical protein JVT61DRAFT_3928 [Boletus reticuloceps]|uniref:Uncharacterized protein n=1 Tax=Boletus reticuloceps TaxID=495285 RepID=A0A8I2YLY0_9AGAM|nr:hypothetical protein JVT61DRAFT_3928 [Boletus reticuloceps]
MTITTTMMLPAVIFPVICTRPDCSLASSVTASPPRYSIPESCHRFLCKLVRSSPAASALVGGVAQQVQKKFLPSLGASGAIYAAVTLTAQITTGVGALVLADIVGILRGWK